MNNRSNRAGLPQVRLQTAWTWDAEFIGYFVAQTEGIYQRRGLEVVPIEGGPSISPESALLEGRAEIAITVPDTTIEMIAAGADLVIVGAQYVSDPLAVLVADGRSRSLQDLRGYTLFVPDVSRLRLEGALIHAGLHLSEVRLMDFAYRPDAMPRGAKEAVVGYQTTLLHELSLPGAPAHAIELDGPKERRPQNTIVVRRSWLADNTDLVTAFLRASQQGWALNAIDLTIFPRKYRESWFNHLPRTLGAEIEHNREQARFMRDDLSLDLDASALAGLGRIATRFGQRSHDVARIGEADAA
jgi:ABC-type nitrate/sulfonate/bicarbonate transport system substrate-binding protein